MKLIANLWSKMHEASRKKIYLILVGVMLIVIVATGSLLYNARNGEVCGNDLDSKIYSEAAVALERRDNKEIQKVIEKIQDSKNYRSDQNCMYAVVSYYAYTKDAVRAQSNLVVLQKAYQQNPVLAEPYKKSGVTNLDILIGRVKELQADDPSFDTDRVLF